MRATAIITAIVLGALTLAPCHAFATALRTAYAKDNGGGPTSPNDIVVQVQVTASIGSVCSVVVAGNPPAGADFGATVALGNSGVIANASGHLLPALTASTSAAAAVNQSFEVTCNGTANVVSLKATPLATVPVVAAPTGYANTVNYTAEVDYAVVGGASPFTLSSTSDSALHTGTFPSGVTLANTANDITVKAYDFTTGANVATDILVASPSYAATITVTIGAGV
ncbi:MAG: hypothetical protein ACHP7N_02410 [Caulobacterales bacterium]